MNWFFSEGVSSTESNGELKECDGLDSISSRIVEKRAIRSFTSLVVICMKEASRSSFLVNHRTYSGEAFLSAKNLIAQGIQSELLMRFNQERYSFTSSAEFCAA